MLQSVPTLGVIETGNNREGFGDEPRVFSSRRAVEIAHRRLDVGVPHPACTRRMSALAIILVTKVWRRSWKRSGRRQAAVSATL